MFKYFLFFIYYLAIVAEAAHLPPFSSDNISQLYRQLDSFLSIFYAFISCLCIVFIIICLYALFWFCRRMVILGRKRKAMAKQHNNSDHQQVVYSIRTSCKTFDSLNPLAAQRMKMLEENDLPPTYEQIFAPQSSPSMSI